MLRCEAHWARCALRARPAKVQLISHRDLARLSPHAVSCWQSKGHSRSSLPVAAVEQWSDTGGPGQEWSELAADDGFHALQNRLNNLLLDASPGNVDQNRNNGSATQNWALIPVGPVKLINASSGKVAQPASDTSAAPVQQTSDRFDPSQHWIVTPASNGGYLTPVNQQSNLALEAKGQKDVVQNPPGENARQQWRFEMNLDGFFELRPRSNLAHLLTAASAADESALILAPPGSERTGIALET
jgi:Ricin-type beta-trefoil lectin domain-like